MPATSPNQSTTCIAQLQALGDQIRTQRKALKVSSTVTAEAAGVSRVTLHRIEKGEPSVTVGAYGNVLAALGLELQARSVLQDSHPASSQETPPAAPAGWIPARIRLADYPQLRSLAWHVQGIDTLTPTEALDIYERNARHLDAQAMSAHEQDLLASLRLAFSRVVTEDRQGG